MSDWKQVARPGFLEIKCSITILGTTGQCVIMHMLLKSVSQPANPFKLGCRFFFDLVYLDFSHNPDPLYEATMPILFICLLILLLILMP